MEIEIRSAESEEDLAKVRALFCEYAEWLGVDLGFQGFQNELDSLPGAYGAPRGRLLLASVDGEDVGCGALRPLSETICEMKRLWVRPGARRGGVGGQLARHLMEEARKIGYLTMRLDTLDHMTPALRLYESVGFKRCAPYYETPLTNTVFLELKL